METEKAKPKKKDSLRSRCSPKGLHAINNGLSDAQKQAVRDIGLGNLLETPDVGLNLKMLKYLDDVLEAYTFPMCKVPSEIQRRFLVIDVLYHEANEISGKISETYDLTEYGLEEPDTIDALRAHLKKDCGPDCEMC